MEEVTLQLTLDEANKILAALGNLPYLKVADLIGKVREQGSAQLSAVSTTENVVENKPLTEDVEQ